MSNILPQQEKYFLRRDYLMRLGVVCMCVLTISMVFAFLLLVPSYFFSRQKFVLAEQRIREWDSAYGKSAKETTDKIIEETNQNLLLLKDVSSFRFTKNILEPLLSFRVSGITFSQVLYRSQPESLSMIEVHGVARDRVVLRAFQDSLVKSGRYSTVDIPLSSFLSKAEIPFSLRLSVK